MAKGQKAGMGWGTRLQIYVLIMGGYYAYKYWKNGGLPDKSTTSSKGDGRDDCKEATTHPQRRFKKVDGSWLSYVEAGSCSNVQLLLLHQTSLSAETEFGATIPQLLKAAPAGGLRVLAIDQPCHGYSPCQDPGTSEAPAGVFARFLAGRPANHQFAYMASGREAARNVLAIVQSRREAARMLLVRPLMVAVDSKGAASSAVVDSARWAVLQGARPSAEAAKTEPLTIGKMPRGCTVTLLYLEGEEEDEALKQALEDADVIVEVRNVDSLDEGIVPAVADMLTVGGASTADSVDEEI